MSVPLFQVDLCAGYGTRTVLRDLRFELHAGEALGFAGSSGAGKSTLALAALGLLPWRGGWVRGTASLQGQDLLQLPERAARAVRGRGIALIPQSPREALNGAVSLRAHLQAAWRAHGPAAGLDARLGELLPELGLSTEPEFLRRRPGSISVGQAQRVLVALALLHRPAVVLADEPTSALDPVHQAQLLALLSQVTRRTGTALLYISHDLLSVLQLCDALAVLDGGSVVERVPVGEVGTRPHGAALEALVAALPAAPCHVRPLGPRPNQQPSPRPDTHGAAYPEPGQSHLRPVPPTTSVF